MSAAQMLSRLGVHVSQLLARATSDDTGWNVDRRRFTHNVVAALALAGDVMLTELVRALPGKTAMKHRYKNFDRMLGEVDLVPVAADQASFLGSRIGDSRNWVIALDLSDIRKEYAQKMESLGRVYDGSTGETSVPGFGLVTACAVDIAARDKGTPIPLCFEVFSSAEEDFVSQPRVWLDAIDAICAASPQGTFAIDREGDNGRILKRLLAKKRDFVVRIRAGGGARSLRWEGRPGTQVVGAGIRNLPRLGTIEATRVTHDGEGAPYVADVSSARVMLPGRPEPLWLCVNRCADHAEPMVLLTTHRCETVEELGTSLARYFARWVIEELHRFAKQAFNLENIRTLTWKRTRNIVAGVAIVLGALAVEGRLPGAECVLRTMEKASDRVEEPLRRGQFWGYALLDGLRMSVRRAPILLRACTWLRDRPPDRQVPLFTRA